jgi:hypothetical protein
MELNMYYETDVRRFVEHFSDFRPINEAAPNQFREWRSAMLELGALEVRHRKIQAAWYRAKTHAKREQYKAKSEESYALRTVYQDRIEDAWKAVVTACAKVNVAVDPSYMHYILTSVTKIVATKTKRPKAVPSNVVQLFSR